jgi:hypothetical protein
MNLSTQSAKLDISKRLADFWLPHLLASEDLFTHLEYVDTSMKELRSEALRRELETFDALLAKEVPKDWRFKEYRKRTIITLAGEITYLRRIYTEKSGICHALLDEVLGIRTRFKLAPDAFLWIAHKAADISFRKTARAFYERTGAKISHWMVMNVVHEEGRLILEEIHELAFGKTSEHQKELKISQDVLFVEFDGVHISLQKSKHEPKKKRRIYEKGRKKHSVELKTSVIYAGKDSLGRRAGVVHFATDESAKDFWPLLNAQIASVYDVRDIERLYTSADAAGWCSHNGVDVGLAQKDHSHHLCRYHLNREIKRAFGFDKPKVASHFIRLAYDQRTKRLMRDLQKVINQTKDEKNKVRYLNLQSFLLSNIDLIKAGPGPSMGTMEGSIAHVYAARMKVWPGGWSRRGAEAMAAIRARIASKKPLIAPKINNALYNDSQIRRRLRFEEKQLVQKYEVPHSVGAGYEPLQGSIVLSTHMAPYLYGILNYSKQINIG